ncbi:MAG: DUF58 domain-containing protein [Phycisphaerales bacterium]|nr:DUF58 domain-containing protein [Phycisphaerales bacterium]
MTEVPTTPLRAEQYLAPETLAQLASFELRAKMVAEGAMNGLHTSPRQGAAVEFASHRQYTTGDSVRHLDWKVFARNDKLYIKQYQQETNLNIAILVDGSASMKYGTLVSKSGWGGTRAQAGSNQWTKFDHATAVAAAISFLSLTQRDRVSVGIFSDGIRGGVRRSSSSDHWRSVVRCLAAEPVSGQVVWPKVADQALNQNTGKTLFVIISDFLAPKDHIRAALARLKHRGNDAILFVTLDDTEIHLNIDADAPFEGMEGEGTIEIDTRAVRVAYQQELARHIHDIDRMSREFGFDCAVFNTHESVGPILSALLAKRQAFARKRSTR